MKTAYFDCCNGISGDMTVGALLDAGADFETLRDMLALLPLEGYRLEAEKVTKHSIAATQFHVHLDEGLAQPHRHLHHITDIINDSTLPEEVKHKAIATFTLLAEAEAGVHNTTIEKVHFHEVGAIDAIIDIVGAQLALHMLEIEQIVVSPLHVGSGTVTCDHGVLPIPAPATARLLQGKPIYSTELKGELVTPTGAALAVQAATDFGPMPAIRVDSIGYGSGTREYADRANVLRVMIGAAEANISQESILVVEATIDDMNPEFFPPLIEALLEAGAKDAFITPIIGKKGRPAFCVTLLCEDAILAPVTGALFKHSTTLGVRMRAEDRMVLERRWEAVTTPFGTVRVKLGVLQGAILNRAPEFEDCLTRAKQSGVSVKEVYDAAIACIVKGE